MPKTASILRPNEKLLGDLRDLIQETRQNVARNINSALVMLYWRVGQRIRKDILEEKRADYGEKIVPTVSAKSAHHTPLSSPSKCPSESAGPLSNTALPGSN